MRIIRSIIVSGEPPLDSKCLWIRPTNQGPVLLWHPSTFGVGVKKELVKGWEEVNTGDIERPLISQLIQDANMANSTIEKLGAEVEFLKDKVNKLCQELEK